jgi:glycerophosphoryl diester phosphodiesterase
MIVVRLQVPLQIGHYFGSVVNIINKTQMVNFETMYFKGVLFLLTFSIFAIQISMAKPKQLDIQGHRGARGLYPENTIPAFIAALDYGVTTIELDLAITKDNQIVVSHEPWMSSAICMDPQGMSILDAEERNHNIYLMTYQQIKSYDCGSIGNPRFPEQKKMVVHKPLLLDVIRAVEKHIKEVTLYEVDYNIEIKSLPAGDNIFHPSPEVFSDLVYNLIDQYLPWDRIVIQSFDFRVLKYWKKKYPEVRLAALVENNKGVDANLKDLGFKPKIYSPYFKLIDQPTVKVIQQKGMKVIPWTVNEIDDLQLLTQWKVDGIITDYPDRAASIGLTRSKLKSK